MAWVHGTWYMGGTDLGGPRMCCCSVSKPNWDVQTGNDASPQQGEEIDVVGTESNQGYGHSIVQGSDCVTLANGK